MPPACACATARAISKSHCTASGTGTRRCDLVLLPQPRGQIGALAQLLDNIGKSLGLARFVNRDDVRMPQGRQYAGLADKPLLGLFGDQRLGPGDLERHETVQLRMPRNTMPEPPAPMRPKSSKRPNLERTLSADGPAQVMGSDIVHVSAFWSVKCGSTGPRPADELSESVISVSCPPIQSLCARSKHSRTAGQRASRKDWTGRGTPAPPRAVALLPSLDSRF